METILRNRGGYEHLDSGYPIRIKGEGIVVDVTVKEVVKALMQTNYGIHRVLSEIAEVHLEQEDPQLQAVGRSIASLFEETAS